MENGQIIAHLYFLLSPSSPHPLCESWSSPTECAKTVVPAVTFLLWCHVKCPQWSWLRLQRWAGHTDAMGARSLWSSTGWSPQFAHIWEPNYRSDHAGEGGPSSETEATMQAYFPIISFLIAVVEEATTRVLGENSSTAELGFFSCEEKFALGYWFSNWALWNLWRFQKFLEDFGRKHRNPEQSPRNSEHLSPMTSSWCLPLHLSILFLYNLLPCDFTTEIKIWESLKNISVYQKKMWDDKAEFFSLGITNKLVFSM